MSATLVLVVVSLGVGIMIGARFGRVILLAALVGAAAWVLVNLPKIVEVVGKARAIAKVMGW
jgi:hypothetical protein